jgi:hypothetical protein
MEMSVSDMPSDTAAQAALASRIDRFIRALERMKRQPNRRETYHVVDALQQLADGRPEDGETAMGRAERLEPLPPHAAVALASNEGLTLEQLRQAFEIVTQRIK